MASQASSGFPELIRLSIVTGVGARDQLGLRARVARQKGSSDFPRKSEISSASRLRVRVIALHIDMVGKRAATYHSAFAFSGTFREVQYCQTDTWWAGALAFLSERSPTEGKGANRRLPVQP